MMELFQRLLAAWIGKCLIQNGLLCCSEVELVQKFGEAASARLRPAFDLRHHARQREVRQVQPQRLQHAGQDGLPAGAGNSLVGAAGLAGFGRAAQRAFGFVVRAVDSFAFAVGRRRAEAASPNC